MGSDFKQWKRMKKAYMLSLGLLVAGCNSTPTIQPSTGASSASLNSVVEHTTESIKDIKRDASGILTETKTARSAKTNSLDKIDSKATNIIESADDLNLEIQKLKKLTVEVDTLEKSLSNLEILMEQTRAKAMEKLYGYISMFWVIGFLLIAGGAAVAFFLNKTYGGSLALIGLLMLGFASASQYYMEQIAFVGAILLVVGFLVAIGMVVWSAIYSKRNATAVREIVEMIQILKESMTADEQNRIFGVNGVASQVQSEITMQIIAKVKEQNGFKKLEEAKKALLPVVADTTKL